MMPAFSPAIAAIVSPRNAWWSSETGRDRGDRRAADDVGRVEPAAEPGLEQHDVGRGAGEGEKGRRGRDLEKGDRRARVDALAFLEQSDEQRVLARSARRRGGCARGSAPDAARCRRARASPPASRKARRDATVEPLPLVPATWIDRRQPVLRVAERAPAAARRGRATGRSASDAARRARSSTMSLVGGGHAVRRLGSAAQRRHHLRRQRLAQQVEHAAPSVAAQLAARHHHDRPCRARADIRRAGNPRAASRGSSPRSPARRQSRSPRPARPMVMSPSMANEAETPPVVGSVSTTM